MSIKIKFTKEEAQAFDQFTALKPDSVSHDDFNKLVFLTGIDVLTTHLKDLAQRTLEEQAKASEDKKPE